MAGKQAAHKWQFKARFRRRAFGWRSQPAITRVKEAVAEIKRVARKDKVLAAEGAVAFLERVSPALEQVDSSSGAIGSAVGGAIAALVPIIAAAPVDRPTRERWLERLFAAHAADDIPYIERLADYWGELCAEAELASQWADRLLEPTRLSLSPRRELQSLFRGTSACLSCLYAAGRTEELVALLQVECIWAYKRWAIKALTAQGKKAEAIRYAESCRGPWARDLDIDQLCEKLLLSSGLADEAYQRYGLKAHQAGTYLAWFRAVAKTYPHKQPAEILTDLVALTPGQEGKWFAAAKDAGLYDEAIALANRTPCAPQTLARAAHDFAESRPLFAMEAGLAALSWLAAGYGYEVTAADLGHAFELTLQAAERAGQTEQALERLRALVARSSGEPFMIKVLARQLERCR